MKRISLTLFFVSLLFGAIAQKIPFQGKLTQNDEPYTGSATMKFAFPAVEWSETHESVSVLDGYYSVVLGSLNPLPDTLFDNSDEVMLSITVDGTALSQVPIYAPFGTKNGRFVIKDTQDTSTVALSVINQASATTTGVGSRIGMFINSSGPGMNTGILASTENGRSISNNTQISDPSVYGLGQLTSLSGTTDAGGRALQAQYTAAGVGHGVGLSAFAGGAGMNWGHWSRANSSLNASDSLQVGTYSEAYGAGLGEHIGVKGIASGGSAVRNIGVYGSAYNSPNENWAGWFDGDVNVNGRFLVNGKPLSGGGGSIDTIVAREVSVINTDGNPKGYFSVYEPNNAGSLVLNGANDTTNVILGGSAGGYDGFLGLYDSVRVRGVALRSSTKYGGYLNLVGQNSRTGTYYGRINLGYGSGGYPYHYFNMLTASNAEVVKIGTYEDASANSVKSYLDLSSSSRVAGGMSPAATMGVNNFDFGYLRLTGGGDLSNDVRAHLFVDSVGSLGSGGKLELFGPVADGSGNPRNIFHVGAVNDEFGGDPTGASAELFLNGKTSPNIQMGGKPWENNDLANLSLYGSTGDGGGWYLNSLNQSVHNNGTSEWGQIGINNIDVAGMTSKENVLLAGNLYGSGGGGLILRSSVDTTTQMNVRSGGIQAGMDPYNTGYVMNMDGVGGPLLEMYNGGNQTIFIDGTNGAVFANSSQLTSDIRLKENIQIQENSLEKIKKMRGVTFEWKSDENNQENIGFIAQEVEQVYPQLVKTRPNGYKSVDYASLVSALVEAIKELDAKVNELENENQILKASLEKKQNDEVAELKAEVEAIKEMLKQSASGAAIGASK